MTLRYQEDTMRRGTVSRLLLAILILFFSAGSVFGAEVRPWYAARLEALGFYVFDQPFEQPNFNVASVDGKMKSRLSTKGNVTLLNFWATWCPPCKEEIPTIQRLHEIMKGEKFEIMAVDLGRIPMSVKILHGRKQITYPSMSTPRTALQASMLPSESPPPIFSTKTENSSQASLDPSTTIILNLWPS